MEMRITWLVDQAHLRSPARKRPEKKTKIAVERDCVGIRGGLD